MQQLKLHGHAVEDEHGSGAVDPSIGLDRWSSVNLISIEFPLKITPILTFPRGGDFHRLHIPSKS